MVQFVERSETHLSLNNLLLIGLCTDLSRIPSYEDGSPCDPPNGLLITGTSSALSGMSPSALESAVGLDPLPSGPDITVENTCAYCCSQYLICFH